MKNTKEVDQYIVNLPDERKNDMIELIKCIRDSMPLGYEEAMTWNMPTWQVPLSMYPNTYNNKPLMYVALASQKNYISLYLVTAYAVPAILKKLQTGFEKAGKPLHMGKGCIRIKTVADVPLTVLADIIASVSPEEYIKSQPSKS